MWKDIPNYENLYQINVLGEIRNKTTQHVLIPCKSPQGYLSVTLVKNKIKKTKYIHRIMGQVFLINVENKKTINHINGIKTDNRVENLEWATYSENCKHAIDTDLSPHKGEKHHKAKLTNKDVLFIRELLKTEKVITVAKLYNMDHSTICDIKHRKIWKHI